MASREAGPSATSGLSDEELGRLLLAALDPRPEEIAPTVPLTAAQIMERARQRRRQRGRQKPE